MNQLLNRLHLKSSTYALFAIAASLSWTSTGFAQQIPNIEVPTVEGDSGTPQAAKKPIDNALSDLQGAFLNLTQVQQENLESELGASIEDGKVTVEAIASGSANKLLQEMEAMGLENGTAFGKVVSGKLPVSEISQAGSLASLKFLRLAQRAVRVGAADNQADTSMQTDVAKLAYGVDGSGISIGILSDSYDVLGGEAADIVSGDIPNGVNVLDDTADGGLIDEGRAMAQLIHDVAPGADLLFHTAFNGAADFAQGILDLAAAGADVIVDDVGYFAQPMFQDGVIAQAVDQVEADGVVYFSSAGNSADDSYEASYSDSGQSLPSAPFTFNNMHDFDPSGIVDVTQEITIPTGRSILLSIQWDEPFASSGGTGSASDLDAYLLDSTGAIVASAINNNAGLDAVEILSFTNNGSTANFAIVIGVFTGPVPNRIKWVDFGNTGNAPNYATFSSTTFGHPNAAGAIAWGAAYYLQTPPFGQSPPLIEDFSSHGGTEILFDIAGNSITPTDRNKPEIVAPDGVDTTFFGSSDPDGTGFPNFFGTSAAAPNAAALAALQLQCDQALTPTQILAHQVMPAIDMGSPGFDNISGDGMVDAVGTLDLSCPPDPPATCNGLLVTVNFNLGQTTTSGPDVVMGTNGADDIRGKGGDDTICGAGGADFIHGNSGDDWIDGGNGVDDIRGGQGNDIIFTGTGSTVGTGSKAFGGNGDDEITGDSGNDDIRGGRGIDTLNGKGGNDELYGNEDGDFLSGGTGFDTLNGGQGDDDLKGGADDDDLNGGGGDDALTGGAGGGDDCDGGSGSGDTASPSCETISNVP